MSRPGGPQFPSSFFGQDLQDLQDFGGLGVYPQIILSILLILSKHSIPSPPLSQAETQDPPLFVLLLPCHLTP